MIHANLIGAIIKSYSISDQEGLQGLGLAPWMDFTSTSTSTFSSLPPSSSVSVVTSTVTSTFSSLPPSSSVSVVTSTVTSTFSSLPPSSSVSVTTSSSVPSSSVSTLQLRGLASVLQA